MRAPNGNPIRFAMQRDELVQAEHHGMWLDAVEKGPWKTAGSKYHGCRVARKFDSETVLGTIVGFLPADATDPSLWKVQHDDLVCVCV